MDVFEAIHTRHMNTNVKQAAVPRALVEKLLSAAVQAPNHYKVRPWRFVVLTGTGLDQLGEVMAASFAARKPDLPPEALDKTRALPHRAPFLMLDRVVEVFGRVRPVLASLHDDAPRRRPGHHARAPREAEVPE